MKMKYYHIKTEQDSWGDILLSKINCPVCGYDFNHIAETEIRHGKDSYQAWQGRGDLVKIFIEGECGHKWNLCLGSHKGQIFIFCEHDEYWSK